LGINPNFLIDNCPILSCEEIEHNMHFLNSSLSTITNNT
jgi:hypothetical protein